MRFFEDRLLFVCSLDWIEWLNNKCVPWNMGIAAHSPSTIRGWREDTPWCAAQFILWFDDFIEVDFDYGNPSQGLIPALLHASECLWNKVTRSKTNPYTIRRWLKRRGIEVEKVK